jgi:serine protease Do
MKARTFFMVTLSLVVVSSSLSAASDGSDKVWPFPLVESEEVLTRWLADTGFELSRMVLGYGSVRLRAVKENGCWQIRLKPRSPLATEMHALYTQNGELDEGKIELLWAYLEGYSKDFHRAERNTRQDVPTAVLSKKELVVCIHAFVDREHIQFSGFIVDREGLMISTAHDLQGIQDITVSLYNGSQRNGYIVAIDFDRDVSLIKIDMNSDLLISLAEGRHLVSMGEKIYSIGCPVNQGGNIQSGIITGPPRRAHGLALLQVSMEVFPGSSGSPVFDAHGHVIGMIKGRYRGTNSVGFLIPLETIMAFLKGIPPT